MSPERVSPGVVVIERGYLDRRSRRVAPIEAQPVRRRVVVQVDPVPIDVRGRGRRDEQERTTRDRYRRLEPNAERPRVRDAERLLGVIPQRVGRALRRKVDALCLRRKRREPKLTRRQR